MTASNRWGFPWVAVGAAVVGILGLMLLKGDLRMEQVKKIRDALRFAIDAQLPRLQVEATLALAETSNEILLAMRREADVGRSLRTKVDAGIASATKHNDEVAAVIREIRDLIAKPVKVRVRARDLKRVRKETP